MPRIFRPLALWIVAAAAFGVAGPVLCEESGAKIAPEWTAEGEWQGSWAYVSRDEQMAFFIRTRDGVPELRFQFQSKRRPEQFATDWEGRAAYFVAGKPATFELEVTERTPSEMRGTWKWDFPVSGERQTNHGRFTLYRTGNGRQMTLRFDEYEQVRYGAGAERRRSRPHSLTFLKASKRIVRWEELPL